MNKIAVLIGGPSDGVLLQYNGPDKSTILTSTQTKFDSLNDEPLNPKSLVQINRYTLQIVGSPNLAVFRDSKVRVYFFDRTVQE